MSAVAMLLVAAYVVLARQAMQLVPEFRQPLESLIEESTGLALDIGQLRGHMDGLSPVLVLERVRLPASTEQESPLTIEHVALTLDLLPSLVQRDLRLRQLLIRGLDMHVTRTEEGAVRFKGMGAGRVPLAPERMLEMLYRQNRVVLDEVALTFEWSGFPPLRTRDLEMVLVNSGRRHQLSLSAESLDGERSLDLRVAMDDDVYRQEDLSGRAYTRLSGPGWERWLSPRWPWAVVPERADGEVALWASLDAGQVRSSTLRLVLDRLHLREDGAGEWPVRDLSVLARLDAAGDGYRLSLHEMNLTSPRGEWRAGQLGLFWNGRRDEALRWQMQARDFSLRGTRELLMGWPFGGPEPVGRVRTQLEELEPAGQVQALYIAGDRSRVASFSGRVRELASETRDRLPGVQGLSGWFSGSRERGVVALDSPALQLDMPRLYEQPLGVRLSGPVRWRRNEEGLALDSGRIRVSNEDAGGDALFSVRAAPDTVPELHLLGELGPGRAEAANRYIPGNRVGEALDTWLDNAFQAGQVTRGRILYQGPVRIDPARQQDRTFQMSYRVRDLRLHYLEGWPSITDLSGRVVLDGRRVAGRDLSGRLLDTRLEGMTFDVPEPAPGAPPELIVAGHLRGPAGDLTHVFQDTPLRRDMPPELARWQLRDGALNGHLLLHWPLGKGGGEPRLRARGELTGAELLSTERDLRAEQLSGEFAYDLQQGLSVPALTGKLFGRPVSGRIESDNGITRVDLDGDVAVDDLERWYGPGPRDLLSGELAYDARLRLPWRAGTGDVRLTVNSPLEGVTVDMPAPLGKTAAEAVPLAFEWTASEPAAGIRFDYGGRLAGLLLLEQNRLTRGHLVVGGGEAGQPREEGLLVTGRLERLAVAPWVEWLRNRPDSGGQGGFPLRRVSLSVDAMDLYGLPVADSQLVASPERDGWQLSLNSIALDAALWLPPDYRADGDTPLTLTVERADLTLPPGREEAVSPAMIPVADLTLNNINVNGTDYGSWRARARPVEQGVRFQDLEGNWRRTSFRGRLDWLNKDGDQQSRYLGSLETGRLHNTLEAWGLEPFVESKDTARSLVDLRWPGSPLDLDPAEMSGTASVEVGACRIPDTSRGASAMRVLGLLNVSSLSRRLRLDFSDLYKKGLSCDSISGDFRIEEARVSTDNLVIKSPSAELRVRGEMDIEAETLDHYMEVILPVSSNLYAGCLAGPAACAGIFVFDRLWGSDLEKMTSLRYRVTGSLEDPKVRELKEGPNGNG